MPASMFSVAQKFVGLHEIAGDVDNPLIVAMLRMAPLKDADVGVLLGKVPIGRAIDEIAWCSAFINFCAFILGLTRSHSLAARSWLSVGSVLSLMDLAGATTGNEVVILKRAGSGQPGPEVLDALGHVGIYAGADERGVYLLAGNQANQVSIEPFPVDRVLGVRRLF